MICAPKVFVSYSWDDENHIEWVRHLCTRLRSDCIDITLDQWHAVPGDQLPQFMEASIRESHFVIIVCSPKYRSKSNRRAGGVGYEGDVIAAELFVLGNHRKFIPILRSGAWEEAAPSWLLGRYYLDFTGSPYTENVYSKLLNVLRGTLPPPPALGSSNSSSSAANPAYKSSIEQDINHLNTWWSEEIVSVLLAVLFGAAFWQVNHLLHWSYGLTFEQVQDNPALMVLGVGETKYDKYMGMAKLFALSITLAPAILIRHKTPYFLAMFISASIIVDLLLQYWRGRGSPSALGFTVMQALILSIFIMVGSIRRDLLRLLTQGDIQRVERVSMLNILFEKANSGWIATMAAVLFLLVCFIAMVVALYVAPENSATWPISPKERQALALLFLVSATAIFCEAALLVWPRCMVLKALTIRLKVA